MKSHRICVWVIIVIEIGGRGTINDLDLYNLFKESKPSLLSLHEGQASVKNQSP